MDVFAEHLNYRGNIFMAIMMNEWENDGTEQFSYSFSFSLSEKRKKKRKGEWIVVMTKKWSDEYEYINKSKLKHKEERDEQTDR